MLFRSLEGNPGRRLFKIRRGEARVLVKDLHMKAGGGGKGIPLDMVNGKNKISKLIASCQGFVSWIAFMVNRAQQDAQFI